MVSAVLHLAESQLRQRYPTTTLVLSSRLGASLFIVLTRASNDIEPVLYEALDIDAGFL